MAMTRTEISFAVGMLDEPAIGGDVFRSRDVLADGWHLVVMLWWVYGTVAICHRGRRAAAESLRRQHRNPGNVT